MNRVRHGPLAVLTLVSLAVLASCSRGPKSQPVRVGCKDLTEQVVLGEIVAQHLERRLGERVERRLPVGGTLVAHQALLAGEIDLYPEYVGVAYMTLLRLNDTTEPAIVRERVKDEYANRFQVTWLPGLGFENPHAVVVREEDAAQGKLNTISDAAGGSLEWKIGCTSEFLNRPDGFMNLMRGYRLSMAAAPKSMEAAQLYRALLENQANMIAGRATDGMSSAPGMKVLKDDKRVFPPFDASLVVRTGSLAARPKLRPALEELSGKLTADTMRRLNREVEGKGRRPAEAAAQFLRELHLQ